MNKDYDVFKGNFPIRLCSNRVWRTYMGGKLLEQWKGEPEPTDSHFPEEWIASLVSARNPCSGHSENEGLSEVEVEPGNKVLLKTLIQSEPELFLGREHVAGFGCDTGLLVKALDSQERLTIQVHPDKKTARRIFDSEFGKTEAWYIIGGREINGEPPYILLGFKASVTGKQWEALFQKQDIRGMVDALHKFYVKPGQVFFIGGGVPHAIGPGCFLIEAQEPTDYTIRVERKTPNGLELPDASCHQGVGFNKMFECFKYEGCSRERTVELWHKTGNTIVCNDEAFEKSLIGYADTPCFSMNSITVKGKYTPKNSNTFSVLIVTDGNGEMEFDKGKMGLCSGDEIFLPVEVRNISFKRTGKSPLSIIRCFPPISKSK